MTDTRAALQAADGALAYAKRLIPSHLSEPLDGAIIAVRAARAALADAPEPVAWHVTYANGETIYLPYKPTGDSGVYGCDPLYSAPPAIAAQDAPPAAPKVTDEVLARAREALTLMADAEVEYMALNKLGDGEKQHNVKYARVVIAEIAAALSPPSAPGGDSDA